MPHVQIIAREKLAEGSSALGPKDGLGGNGAAGAASGERESATAAYLVLAEESCSVGGRSGPGLRLCALKPGLQVPSTDSEEPNPYSGLLADRRVISSSLGDEGFGERLIGSFLNLKYGAFLYATVKLDFCQVLDMTGEGVCWDLLQAMLAKDPVQRITPTVALSLLLDARRHSSLTAAPTESAAEGASARASA